MFLNFVVGVDRRKYFDAENFQNYGTKLKHTEYIKLLNTKLSVEGWQ